MGIDAHGDVRFSVVILSGCAPNRRSTEWGVRLRLGLAHHPGQLSQLVASGCLNLWPTLLMLSFLRAGEVAIEERRRTTEADAVQQEGEVIEYLPREASSRRVLASAPSFGGLQSTSAGCTCLALSSLSACVERPTVT